MTLRKPSLAALAAIAALVGGMSVADTAAAQYRRGGTSFSFSFGSGPAYGYGYGPPYGYYNNGYRYGPRPYPYRAVRPYYAPPRYAYRGARYRGCDRWMWDGWRQTYVLVRGRC